MATHTSLADLFGDIADSIRAKTGENRQLVADNFPAEIDAISGGIEDVATAAEMDAKLTAANAGKMYHYTGTTTSAYVNGRYYKVESSTGMTIEQVGNYGFVEDADHTYEGHGQCYKSTNQDQDSSYSIVKVTIQNCTSFTVCINSYAESNYDYTMASIIDAASYPTVYTASTAQINTRGYQYNPSTSSYVASQWKSYTYSNLVFGTHFVYVVFRKDNSTRSGDDTSRFFIDDIQGLSFKEYLNPNGDITITQNGTVDVASAKNAVVNVVPTGGTISITENGLYDVTNYSSASVNVSGGGAGGYKIYLYSGGIDDGAKIKINETTEYDLAGAFPDAGSFGDYTVQNSIQMGGIQTIRMWAFDHGHEFPSTTGSWVRWRVHGSSTWNNYTCSRMEAASELLTLTADIDLEIWQAACLNKGTLITMADGSLKPVEEIEVGDLVMNYDGTADKVRHSQKGYKQYLEFRDIWRFEDGYEIITTGRHEFYNFERQKVTYLDEWSIGEHAITQDGKKVALIEHIHEDIPCMHFSLWTENENYFAGGLLAGNRFTGEIHIK